MGAPPASDTSVVARLATARPTAEKILAMAGESFDDTHVAVSAFEDKNAWQVAIHFREPPNETAVRALVALAAGAEAANGLVFERIAGRDWVKASLDGLAPVALGRFFVHGAHDRARVPRNAIGIEIEAALAFGTGHHGTTQGCLLALDRIVKQQKRRQAHYQRRRFDGAAALPSPREHLRAVGRGRGWGAISSNSKKRPPTPAHAFGVRRPSPPPKRVEDARKRACGFAAREEADSRRVRASKIILDIGTGSGVLAIAAARALHRPVLASDIDILAVRAARGNARLNRAGSLLTLVHAPGLTAHAFRRRAPFDLVFANILLEPIRAFAAPMAKLLAPGARLVLSGLLTAQAQPALAAYLPHGLALEARIHLSGWVTLVLHRRKRS